MTTAYRMWGEGGTGLLHCMAVHKHLELTTSWPVPVFITAGTSRACFITQLPGAYFLSNSYVKRQKSISPRTCLHMHTTPLHILMQPLTASALRPAVHATSFFNSHSVAKNGLKAKAFRDSHAGLGCILYITIFGCLRPPSTMPLEKAVWDSCIGCSRGTPRP